ncbi:hypothetical protein MJG53_004352 [Ovis ammon polii x Ovis aries]|uniref:Uncharacterized protein n=1 Tax=Ovis ammon polii x Ovis aries TaxID=2918886 RepID=A0ACB9V9E9_9CETA|nr:hypothetical protein MJG53_004352 [Ovis ammon polii x Ovis aries]
MIPESEWDEAVNDGAIFQDVQDSRRAALREKNRILVLDFLNLRYTEKSKGDTTDHGMDPQCEATFTLKAWMGSIFQRPHWLSNGVAQMTLPYGQESFFSSSGQLDVCYPNKKEVYSCQHNAIWLFSSQAIGGRPLLSKGTTQRERSSREQLSSSLIKKLFVRQHDRPSRLLSMMNLSRWAYRVFLDSSISGQMFSGALLLSRQDVTLLPML